MARNSVKLLLAAFLAFAGIAPAPAPAQNAYPLFEPADGILVGDPNTYVTTPAAWSDIAALLSGTCTTSEWLRGDGACVARGTLSGVNDTNVTLTLGGTPSGSLLNSTSLTLGWTGTLAASRGGLGMSTVTDDTVPIANGTTWVSSAVPNCLDTSGNHLNYNASTNTISCGTSSSVSPVSPANPTATIGLVAVNGTSPNFIRSDGAPALSQAIAPTWTATHTFSNNTGFLVSNAAPLYQLFESDAAVDARYWTTRVNGSDIEYRVTNDAQTVNANYLAATRSGTTISNVSFGNVTNNPTYSFLGTGAITSGGVHLGPVGSATAPTYAFSGGAGSSDMGMYRFGSNQLGFATAGAYRASLTAAFADFTGSAQIYAPAGTVSLPAYSWAADTNTGFYKDGTDGRINFSSNAAALGYMDGNEVRLDGTGFLRIRPTFATAALRLQARTDTTADATWVQFYRDNGTTERGYVGFGSNGSDTMTVLAQLGNLNLSSTSGTVNVTAAARFSGTSAPITTIASDGTGDNYIRAMSSDGTTPRWYIGNGSSASNEMQISNDVSGQAMFFSTTGGGLYYFGPDNNATGSNVSIGSNATCTIASANRGCLGINGASNGAYVEFLQGEAQSAYIGASTSNFDFFGASGRDMRFYTNGNGSPRATIATDGGMFMSGATGSSQGLGTVNATGLFVNGTAVCRSDGTNCPSSTLTRVVKSVTTSRSSTTTLSADPELTFAATGTASYKVEACLRFNGTTTGTQGIKFVLNRTTAGSNGGFWGGNQYVGTTGTAIAGIGTPGSPGTTTGQLAIATIDVSGSVSYACLKGVFDLTSGVSYAIEWAQNSSNANNTNMLAGSYVEYSRVN